MNLTKEKTTYRNDIHGKFSAPGKTIFGALFQSLCSPSAFIRADQLARADGDGLRRLGNFDVINHTGHDGHGFEIETQGIQPNDIYYSFSAERYGAAILRRRQPANGSMESAYVNGAFAQTTLPHQPNTPFAGSCFQWGANYNESACEHFGVSLLRRRRTPLIAG